MKQKVLLFLASAVGFCNLTNAQNATETLVPADTTKGKTTDTVVNKNEGGIIVNPANFDFKLDRGQETIKPLKVKNNFKTKMQFTVKLMDWMRDSLGGHDYQVPGTFPRSCAQWITFNKEALDIEPGKTEEVLVRIKVPDNDSAVEQMKWCLIFLETVAENLKSDRNDSTRITTKTYFRVGIHVMQTPPDLVNERDLSMLSFSKVGQEDNKYRILCQNTGKTQLNCESYIELSSLSDGKKIKLDPVKFPLFPDQRRYSSFTVPPTVPKGKYTALAVVDAGLDDVPIQASEANIEVK